jgi:type II secretory pathway pseudopilin PulG
MKKRPITLIELMLVITIAAIAIGALGFTLPKALREERFKKNTLEVLLKIQTATDLMLAYDTDVILAFHRERDGLHASYATSKPLPPQLLGSLNRKEVLKEIADIEFNGKNTPLVFSSSNGQTPDGRLTIKGKKEMAIQLPGYPTPYLKREHEKKKNKAPYPKEALSSS